MSNVITVQQGIFWAAIVRSCHIHYDGIIFNASFWAMVKAWEQKDSETQYFLSKWLRSTYV